MGKPADRRAASRQGLPPDVHADDEIEILEVVGLDEDAAPGSAVDEADPEDSSEIVLEFGDEPATAGDRPEPATPPAPTVALERFVRLQADFENLRKRSEREREEHGRVASGGLVARLLPILDNLERAMASPPVGDADRTLREGLALVHRQFVDELRHAGLRPVAALGEIFDPVVHEAVETVSAGDAPPNTVVDELQRGYWFHDRVLRPALVRVAIEAEGGVPSDGSGEEG